MRVLGMISGTSHDGIDAAVVDFDWAEGALTGTLRWATSVPYAPALRERLIAALPPNPTTLREVCELDTLIGQAFAQVADQARQATGTWDDPSAIEAVCSHGQTVYHWVEDGRALGTLQIGQPSWIAELLGVAVVSDIRIRDLTVGGHGAPLASYIDALVLRGRSDIAGALNLGGISNMTVVTPERVYAYDVGPSNALMDAVIVDRGLNEAGYDVDAAIGSSGQVNQTLLDQLLAEPYYTEPVPKSTGKELFNLDYVIQATADLAISDADLIATLTELTAQVVANDVATAGVSYLMVSGGGTRNPLLMSRLAALMPNVTIEMSDQLGLPADSKEAILMALIGWCTLHGVPAIVPGGTGSAEPRILGTITPGAGPLQLPPPVTGVGSLHLVDGSTR